MPLSKQIRSPHSPSPIYGDGSMRMNQKTPNRGLLRPGFNVGDIDRSATTSLLVYGTYVWATATDTTRTPNTVEPFPPAGSNQGTIQQTSIADATGTTVSPHARVVKITIHVSGTGTIDISCKSAVDSFAAVVFDSGALAAGAYDFYVGGWSSPTSNSDATYIATQYGPIKPGNTPSTGNTTGDQETNQTKVNTAADSNYVGPGYNPVDFTSLDGFDLKFFSVLSGSASWDVEVTPVS